MFASVGLTISALIFTMLIAIVYLTKRKYYDIQNSLFRFLLLLTIFLLVLELYAVYFMMNRETYPLLNEILCRIYVFGAVVWFISIVIYVWLLGKEDIYDKKIKLFKEPFVIVFILIGMTSFIISCFLPITYTSGVNEELYVIGGQGVLCLYIVFAFVGSFMIYILFKNKNKASFFKRLPIFFFLVFYFIMIVFQYFYTDINDLTFMLGLTMVATYFTIVSQDFVLVNDLEEAKKVAENANKEKTEFLSKMSHEIRTPMNAIMGFSESLLNDDNLTSEKVIDEAKNINLAGNNLIEIINNILDVSRLDSGKEEVELKNYFIKDVVYDLISFTESKINKEKVNFRVLVAKDIPNVLYGDKHKINRVLKYLLNNSAKFTNSGEIKLEITSVCENDIAKLKFVISDTGLGIKEEDFDKVFAKFAKIDNDTERMQSGSGLGLSIAKALVELMGGTIDFKSEFGIGTTFIVTLENKIIDFSECGDILAYHEDSGDEKVDFSDKKVLIVDDNKINLKILTKLLNNYNIQVKSVENGYDCIDLAKKKEEFDLIFMDHLMPDLDGLETLRILKKIPGYKVPDVIAVTANSIDELGDDYLKEGFSGFLSKPIDTKELNKLLNKMFRK